MNRFLPSSFTLFSLKNESEWSIYEEKSLDNLCLAMFCTNKLEIHAGIHGEKSELYNHQSSWHIIVNLIHDMEDRTCPSPFL